MPSGKTVSSPFWLLWVLLSGLCWIGFFWAWLWVPYLLFGGRGVLLAIPIPFACVGFGWAGFASFDKRNRWIEEGSSTAETVSKGWWSMSVHPTILTARGGYFFAVQLLFLAASLMVGPRQPGLGMVDSALIFSSMGCAALLPAIYNEDAKRYILWAASILYGAGVVATAIGMAMFGLPSLGWR